MKKFLLLSLGAALLFSCNNEKAAEKAQASVQVKSAATEVDPKVQKLESLKKAETLSLDKLSDYLPKELSGIKRSSVDMASNLGYGRVHADYEKNAKTDIRVTLFDCAGEAGARLYTSTYEGRLGFSQDNADGYTKTIEFRGAKAIEGLDKATNVAMLTFMLNDQVLVVMTGRNLSADDLKLASEKITVK